MKWLPVDDAAEHTGSIFLPRLHPHAISDVAKDNHGAPGTAMKENGIARVRDGKGGAILAPEDLILAMVHLAVTQSLVDRALFLRVMAAVRVGVMHHAVLGTFPEVHQSPACRALCSWVHEGNETFRIQAVDAFFRLIQNPLIYLPEATGRRAGLFPRNVGYCRVSAQQQHILWRGAFIYLWRNRSFKIFAVG